MIKDAFLDLCSNDKEFVESTEIGTYSTDAVVLRTEKQFRKLRATIGYPEDSERFYTYEDKKNIYMIKPMEFVNYVMIKFNMLKMHKQTI